MPPVSDIKLKQIFDTGLEQCLLLASEEERSVAVSSQVKGLYTPPLQHTEDT